MGKLKDFGIEPGKPFDITKMSPPIQRGLERALRDGPTKLQQGVLKTKTVNGWMNRDTATKKITGLSINT